MNLDLSYYVSVFLRRIYVMIIVAVGMTAAAIYVAIQLPPTYRAAARLLVESPQIPTNLAASTVQVETQQQLQIIEQRLMTRENLLQIARQYEVYPNIERMSADEVVERMREDSRIVRSVGRSQATLMSVAFTSNNGRTAAAVANEYVTRVLEANRTLRTQLAEQTLDFFLQEVQRLDEELARRSAEILAFKKQNADALPSSLGFRQDRQSALQERLNQTQRELALLDEHEKRLNEIFAAGGDIGGPAQLSPDAVRLQKLNADLESALAVMSPTNPRVRLLEAQVNQVKSRILASASTDTAAGPSQNPQQSMFDLRMAEIQTSRESMEDQRVYLETEIAALSDSIARTPEIAAAIDSLERDYANVRSQYDESVKRSATAATGERIELLSKGERISVIEQASIPNKPNSPNRPMIAGAGAAAGIALGSAMIVLLEFFNQSIRRPIDIERHLGVTPIATLPYIRTRREIIWKRLILIGLIAFVVIGGPLVIYLVHTYAMPLDLIIDTILSKIGV